MDTNTLLFLEESRQHENIELIASENFVSDNIKRAVGSCLTNKYCEGYPEAESIKRFMEIHPDYIHTGKIDRYYGGCQEIDQVELSARYAFQKLFNTNYHVNVQPHSGSNANMGAYLAVLNLGDTVLSMSLSNGGHLTHGAPVNFSGKLYNFIHYNVDSNGFIDFDDFKTKIITQHPKLIVAGASAYSRTINFEKMKSIIDECSTENYKPLFMVDMAHIAGLVAAGYHPTPFGYADIITTTTHKTLRGPRGGVIFCKPELAYKIDSAVFPCMQGGPLMHVIAGKLACALEANTTEFKQYISKVITNAKEMANTFKQLGYKVVTGGTDNHLFLLDLSDYDITGQELQNALDKIGITLNKNCIPNEKRSPMHTSGVRIGTAAMTTKGYTSDDFIKVAYQIDKVIKSYEQK